MKLACLRLVLALGACLGVLPVMAADEVPDELLRLCIAPQPYLPYSDPAVETSIQRRIRAAAATQGFAVVFKALPWRRCVYLAGKGETDGVVGMSDRLTIEQGLHFPLRNGVMDPRRTLNYMPFKFFRRKGEAVDWDGRQFHRLQGEVLVLNLAVEITHELERLGTPFNDTARGPHELASMLLAGRGNLAVDAQTRVQALMEQPEFAGRLEMLNKPLGGRWAILAIAPHRYQRQPQRIEALWDEYARLREAEELASGR